MIQISCLASPYSRRDTKDSFNDETFGSSDSTNEDRAEEERNRRASFELLRKEQHKEFQERQKLDPEKRKKEFDFAELLGDSKNEKGQPDRSNQVSESSTLLGSNSSAPPPQNTTPRPLVPPGFASTLLERKQGAKPPTEVSQHEGSLLDSKDGHLENGMSGNNEKPPANQTGSNELLMKSTDASISTKASERAVNLSTVLGVTTDTVGKDKSFEKLSCMSNFTEASGYSEKSEQAMMMKLDQKKSSGNLDGPSILDKLFNTALNLNGGNDPNFTERNNNKVEERLGPLGPQTDKSSKFAYLFLEGDSKPLENISSSEHPTGLQTLLRGSNKSQTSDVKSDGELCASLPFQGPDQLSKSSPNKSATAPPVLTCEDLEQSILSEVTDSYSAAVQDSDVSSIRTKQQEAHVDDQASQHLLSLLQRGPGLENQVKHLSSNTESRPPTEKLPKTGRVSREADTGNSRNIGKTLTLETLFGSAFMKELQSVGEPVSAKGGISEASLGLDQSISELIQRDQMRSDGLPRFSAAGVGLPGEDSLPAVDDSAKVHKYMPFQGFPNQEPEVPFNITEKLAAINSGPRNGRPPIGGQESPFLHHPPQYTNGPDLPFQPSSAHSSHLQLRPSHLNGSGPLFHSSLDPRHGNVKSQIDLMASGSLQRDPPPSHQFSANMIQPPFHLAPGGVPEFDHRPHPILQQMHMRGNMAHPHLVQGFPGGPPHHHPPGVNNQMPGVVSELNASQGLPFAHRQPNFTGHNMPPPVMEVNRGDHNTGSLQRLLGMETKQVGPMGQGSSSGPRRQGSLGHDLAFGYR
ncbi:PREDICTED: uncharacterized protein LOC104825859 isoform X2 [Tarenaya hassleriana]|uniref:uncharacterized protein LOC104825859 isoform X2 n=1 Tax=Tarenaya hassleriana TaxID=28532 RepID=UPI00053C08F4|nr:PREDICTED: uncharacterized protein LOC104825859 isoform X2 [Tarenaya hassleriana]